MIKFLISGCSFTTSWPAWLEHLGCVRNLAMAGAGNEYIAESIIHEISTSDCEYDYVMVMWSGLQRIDIRVDPLAVKNPGQCPLDGIDYVPLGEFFIDKEYRSLMVNGNELTRGYKSLMEIIKLQSFLKAKNIRYSFMSYANYWNDKDQVYNRNFGIYKYPLLASLAKQIDFDRFIFGNNNDCIWEVASSIDNGIGEDGFHPSFLGIDKWMTEFVFPKLKTELSL